MKQRTIDLWNAFLSWPAFVYAFVSGLLIAVMSDPIVASLAVGAVAVGLLTNALTAVAVFFLLYAVIRVVNTVANAIGNGAQGIGVSLRQRRGSDG